MGQILAVRGLGRWIAQKRGSLDDFPFHSPLYHSDLDLPCSGPEMIREMLAHKLQCEKWLVVMDACPPRLSH